MKSIWKQVKSSHVDEKGNTHIDAWLTDDQMEDGRTIAIINKKGTSVRYLDDRASSDSLALKVTGEALHKVIENSLDWKINKKQLLVDKVIDQIKKDCEEKDYTAIEGLLLLVPNKTLKDYLPEDLTEKFEK